MMKQAAAGKKPTPSRAKKSAKSNKKNKAAQKKLEAGGQVEHCPV
jgi:hypothetical protein